MKKITETQYEKAMKILIEQMEKILTDIEKNTRPLPQIPLEDKNKENHFKMDLQDSIDLTDGN